MADPNPNPNALFAQLLPFMWRGVGFPACNFKVSLRQDLAVHAYMDRSGAHVEGTGRAPLQFDVRIPFLNTVEPGLAEEWGVLYPTQWRKFLAACADKTTDILQHPELGPVKCVLQHCDTVWDADKATTGVWVEASWLEDAVDPTASDALFAQPSPVAKGVAAFQALDYQLGQILPGLGPSGMVPLDFTSFMRSLQSIGDQATLLAKRGAGTIDSVAYRVQNLKQSFDFATTTTLASGKQTTSITKGALAGLTLNGPPALYWPLLETLQASQDALDTLRAQLLAKSKPIVLYVTPQATTLGGIAVLTKADMGDLITLNRPLVRSAIVPANTTVRYYAAA